MTYQITAWSFELQGFDSVMVDGSHLPFEENMAFTNRVVKEARTKGLSVEAEIGRLSGTEDGLTVEEYEARLTSVDQVGNLILSLLNNCPE